MVDLLSVSQHDQAPLKIQSVNEINDKNAAIFNIDQSVLFNAHINEKL